LVQGASDGPSTLISLMSENKNSAAKLCKKREAQEVATANTNPSASLLDLIALDDAMATMEKATLQNVYHEKMLLYRNRQVAQKDACTVCVEMCFTFDPGPLKTKMYHVLIFYRKTIGQSYIFGISEVVQQMDATFHALLGIKLSVICLLLDMVNSILLVNVMV
jgi:hypothetical protein